MNDMHRRMGIASTLERIADALSAGAVEDALESARAELDPAPTTTIPFRFTAAERARVAATSKAANLKPADKLAIYQRDGFIDRYSPERWRLLNPGALRVLSLRLGSAMATELSKHNIPAKYATNSPVWFDVWPAVDHINARAHGGNNDARNLITCSWWRNAAKGSRALDETSWQVQEPGSLDEWDGLTTWFEAQVASDRNLLNDPMVRNWYLPGGPAPAAMTSTLRPPKTASPGGPPPTSDPRPRTRRPKAARPQGTGTSFDQLLSGSADDVRTALANLTAWTVTQDMTSHDTPTSRVFSLAGHGLIWFFVPTGRSTRELELDLKKLRSAQPDAARAVLHALGDLGLSPSSDYPRVPHRAIVRRWEAVRDRVLEPYVAGYRRA